MEVAGHSRMEIVSKMQNAAVITFIIIITLLVCSTDLRAAARPAFSRYLQRELHFAFAELEVRVGFTLYRFFF